MQQQDLDPQNQAPQMGGASGAETESKPAWPVWDCSLSGTEGKELAQITVGDHILINCKGEYLQGFKKPLSIYFLNKEGKKIPYVLHPLEVLSIDEQSLKAVVTSYVPANHNSEMYFDGGGKVFKSNPLNWSVKSVIEKQDQKPYGFYEPVKIPLPMWYWAIFIVGGLIALGLIIRMFKKRNDRKKLIEELKTHGTALSPYNQFNKDLRKITRELGFYKESNFPEDKGHELLAGIENEFRLYLTRELKVPALKWKDKETLKEIKKFHFRVYKERGVDIERLFREIERIKGQGGEIRLVDCQQIVEISRTVCDGVFQVARRQK